MGSFSGSFKDNVIQSTTFNVSNISGFQNFTVNNFAIKNTAMYYWHKEGYSNGRASFVCPRISAYNNNTGVVTVYGIAQGLYQNYGTSSYLWANVRYTGQLYVIYNT